MLTSEERSQIVEALRYWAGKIPDEPMLGFLQKGLEMADGEYLTPHQIVAAVLDETPDGIAVLDILEHGVRREGIEKVVARFRRIK